MQQENYLTIAEVAKSMDVTVQRVHQLIKTYEITAIKRGNMKFLKRKDANRLAKMNRPTGVHVAKKSGD